MLVSEWIFKCSVPIGRDDKNPGMFDPVYTDVMADLIDLACNGKRVDEQTVFLHTGGTVSLFRSLASL